MKTTVILIVLVVLGLATYAASRLHEHLQRPDDETGARAATPAEDDELAPRSAPFHVRVMTAHRGSLPHPIVLLGSVVPAQDALQAITAPTDVRLLHVLVSAGDHVHVGMEVAQAELSPEALASRQAAVTDREQAQLALANARERLSRQLGTQQELQQAIQALAAAEPRAAMWSALGAQSPLTIRATSDATVIQVPAHPGQLLGAGAVICECAGAGIDARLGGESGQVHLLQPSQELRISFPGNPPQATLTGHLRSLSSMIDPESHMVDVLVGLPTGCAALGTFVRAEASTSAQDGWLLPRQAVDPTEDGDVLYTVSASIAHQRHVTILSSAGDLVVLASPELSAGELVIIQGNVELHDGSAVIVDR